MDLRAVIIRPIYLNTNVWTLILLAQIKYIYSEKYIYSGDFGIFCLFLPRAR